MKRRHVFGEHRRRVALGVDRNEQDLHPAGVLAEFVGYDRQLPERGRTHVGAMRVAEEDRHHLALEIGERAGLAVVVGELKIAPELGAGEIGELERRLGG